MDQKTPQISEKQLLLISWRLPLKRLRHQDGLNQVHRTFSEGLFKGAPFQHTSSTIVYREVGPWAQFLWRCPATDFVRSFWRFLEVLIAGGITESPILILSIGWTLFKPLKIKKTRRRWIMNIMQMTSMGDGAHREDMTNTHLFIQMDGIGYHTPPAWD